MVGSDLLMCPLNLKPATCGGEPDLDQELGAGEVGGG